MSHKNSKEFNLETPWDKTWMKLIKFTCYACSMPKINILKIRLQQIPTAKPKHLLYLKGQNLRNPLTGHLLISKEMMFRCKWNVICVIWQLHARHTYIVTGARAQHYRIITLIIINNKIIKSIIKKLSSLFNLTKLLVGKN